MQIIIQKKVFEVFVKILHEIFRSKYKYILFQNLNTQK